MERFCFIALDNINRMPYIYKYIQAESFKFDLIYWDRSVIKDECGAEEYYRFYSKHGKRGLSKIAFKFIAYISFGFYASKILIKNDYAGVFVFTPNAGAVCLKVLKRKYANRYILDIRDLWREDRAWFRRVERVLEKYSYANVISSEAYKQFLPDGDYIMSHNSQLLDDSIVRTFREKPVNTISPITLSCIGGIKNAEFDKRVLLYFANDERFIVEYIGRGYDQLQLFCFQNAITNVKIEGIFSIEHTIQKYKGTDIVLNMYGSHDIKLDHALSNKLYFAVQLGLPILVCPGTYMAEVAVNSGIGFALDLSNPNDINRLYEYYVSLDRSRFIESCDRFLSKVKADELVFRNAVSGFITYCSRNRDEIST